MTYRSNLFLLALLAATLACSIASNQQTPTPIIITKVVVIPNVSEATPMVLVDTPIPESPLPTETPSGTATVSPTATLSGPAATFIKNANCRQGPGTQYETVTSFLAGQTVEIVGRNPDFDNTWWYVKIPDSNGKCWVSLTTAQAYGDFDSIPTQKP
jgi:uncharacterized protein YgiM (DUF1202 family)